MNTRKSGLEDVLPLSPLQQGLLFHSEYATEADDPYLVQFVLDLEGPLEPAVLRAAARALIDRHANLRACFRRRKNGEVLAPVPRAVELPWRELDLDESDWDGVLAADRVERFDLAQAPLLRVLLAKLGPNRHRLLLTYHHILLDGWSTPLLARELFQLYTAKGDASKLPAVRPYKDYLSWLRNKDADAARAAWAEALRGVEEPSLLAPGADPSGSAEQTPIALPDGLLDGMASLARSAGVTLNTVVQAAWALLLARTLGRQDVVFGATVSGRPADLPGVESMIGLFINTVPVRVRLEPAETVTALLARVQAEQARVMDHQQLGLADIQRTVGIGELFDTLTVFESYFVDTAALESAEAATGLRVRAGETRDATHYPATLVATGGELLLKYRPGLVDPDALTTRLVRVLTALVADPTAAVARVDGLSDTERGNLVHGWNPTGQRGAVATIPARFAEQVTRAPEAVALVAGTERISYAELDDRSDRLAQVLVERGARPGGIVAIGLPRSANLVVAVLAVLKSGAAYLPLDPSYPRARLDLMLADAAPTLLITDLDDFDVPTVSPTDSSEQAFAPVALSSDSPAYVIYTSGSTGTPKGVLVPHRTVDRLLSATDHWFGFGANDVWTLFHSYAFDFSVWELWGALLRGGTLVVVDHATSRSPEAFLELLERERVTVLNQTPSAFHQLDAADAARGGVDLALRYVIFGGEALEPRKLAGWYERHADDAPRLVNMYGITETTVHVTYLPLTRAAAAEGTPDIGVPIPDLRAYVLDDGLSLAAPGVVGELYVAGEGLADGYLNRPGLTSTRFVANPFGQGRLYRSGDLARWRSDGTLEYFGRADGQVKLRGFRIELGEIEAVLSAHPNVAHAVAVVREDRTTRLVAYVVPTAGATVDDLREWAARDLPEHMVPAAVVVLDRIPLTPNGKVDRAALPAPDFAGLTTTRQAETEAEQTLAAVFAEVLGVPAVGMDDDFFSLGGDSIISIQLVARARAEGLRFSPRDVFERRTVARIAEVATEPAVVVTTSGTGTLPLTPIMRELLGRGGPITRVAQARLLVAPAGLTLAKLTAAVQSVVDTHDVLRARLVGDALEVRPVGSVTAAVRQVESIDHAGEAARSYAELDPAAGEVLRVVWFAPDRLLIIAHHLVVDGVSWRIIVPDLADAVEGKALVPIGTSFREWATELAAQDRTAELDHWRATVDGVEGRQVVAARDTVSTVRSVRVSVSQETTARLLGAVPAAYRAGVEDVLLTALALALATTRGVPWHVVDREGHGRVEDAVPGADLHRTVGWFTTLHPVRLDLSGVDIADAVAGGPAAGLALKQVKELLRAVPGDGIGFGLLRDSLPAGTPEVLFNYLGRFGSPGSATAWSGAPEAAALGGDANPELPVSHALAINAVTADGALTATFSWPAALFDQVEVDHLAAAWVSALDAIDRHAATGATGRTPSDFPLVDLGQTEVDTLVAANPGLVDVWRPTPLQQGIAFLSRFDDTGTDVYNVQFACELTGPLDPARLRAAGQALLDRHDTLRSAIAHVGSGDPVLVVQQRVDLPWREVDGDDWERVVAQDQQTRFDVTTAPLVRFTLGRVDVERHRLLLSFHHVLLDGWSTPLLVRELFELYAGNALPAVRPYRDFLAWLSERDAGVQPWAKALAGAESTLVAPAGAARSGALPRRVDLTLPDGLAQVARECGVTLNTLVQAAWGLTVARGLGRQDVVFGATVSGRPADLPGVESMIGLFINTLPVRVRLDPTETVAGLLTRVQAEQAALLDHQHIGLADIQRAVGVGELFDTLTVFESFPIDTAALDRAETAAGFQVSGVTGADATNYPITLTVGGGLSAWLDVRDDLVSAELVTAWAERFVRALAAFAAPGSRVRDLDLMSDADRSAFITNGPVVDVTDSSVLDVLARQDPSMRAVVGPDAELTYGELSDRADQIAGLLQSRGVRAGDVVALALPPSAGLVAAIIGVWKAGAAYLVLDPEYPADRLRHMVAEARPALTLTISAVGMAGAVEIDSVSRYEFRGGPVSGAAYVIFTSGSTGRPKGVLVEHAGLVNLLASHEASVMRPGSVLQAASFSFDASLDPLLWMVAGHEMHVVAEPNVEYVRANGIAYVDAAPSLLGQLVSDGLLSSGVSVVGTGGESVSAALWAELAASSVEAFNFYGPTECTVDAVVAPVVGSDVVIGRPVANSAVYVLDSALGLVAPGVVGELYVGGPGVARGYLGQPGLTASRFVANPFGDGRLYRTGDLVRWSSGSLEFLGRADDQVKVRGFRVELGEVETVLAEHPAVTAAIATVRDGRLIAHVIGNTDLRAHAASLLPDHMVPSAFVAVDEFPLLPNGKVNRAALPDPDFASLVSTRAATTEVEATLVEIFAAVLGLPTVGVDDDFFALGGDSIVSIQLVSRARTEGLRFSPRDVFEQRTVAALAHVAEPDKPTLVPDNGTGLIPFTPIMRSLLELDGPIGRFAQVQVLRAPADLSAARLVAAVQKIVDTHAVLRARLVPDGLDVTDSLDAVDIVSRVPGPLDVDSVLDTLDPISGPLIRVAWFPDAAPSVHPSGSSSLSSPAATSVSSYPQPPELSTDVSQSPVRGGGTDRLAQGRPPGTGGGWTRGGLAVDEVDQSGVDGVGNGVVVVAVHHLAVDGVSWRVLVPDLVAAYGGAELEPVGTSFRGWALGLGDAAEARSGELAHWRAVVAEDEAPLGDRGLDGDTVSQLKRVVTTVPDDVAEPLLGAVPELFHAEVDDILLTGFALGLARWSDRYRGQRRTAITVDLESHGRDEDAVPGADLHRTVGWFTSVHPVRLDLAEIDIADAVSGGPAAGRAVKQVKECLRSTPGSGIGFGLLSHAHPDLAGRRQVLFNYLGRFDTSSAAGPWSALPGIGGGADAEMPAEYPLQVDITTVDGPEFRIAWTYPDGVFTERDIRDLATCVAGALRAVAEHGAEEGAGGLTPSDLLVPGFAQEQIDRFEANWRNL
ncbi:amino acid adenylation domain-containing protein/non-ribosomal peptide synthase protein (TIGR01720 family) [Actinokineospora baliensis]|uniref:non-ribosomal peptide synthetase n=1 Tax=Actinokineospora baliensis TaxID=547056 RepID=UPI00195C3304|nr:non-ribosomal peptide synthetase [Actinokineospora baliensis]MBM7773069.1 amino acid adenylation domain-containing protein/non-ribosomal peptide synthase protein (TIGR01720 family) [Actinokineospora baliensis]